MLHFVEPKPVKMRRAALIEVGCIPVICIRLDRDFPGSLLAGPRGLKYRPVAAAGVYRKLAMAIRTNPARANPPAPPEEWHDRRRKARSADAAHKGGLSSARLAVPAPIPPPLFMGMPV